MDTGLDRGTFTGLFGRAMLGMKESPDQNILAASFLEDTHYCPDPGAGLEACRAACAMHLAVLRRQKRNNRSFLPLASEGPYLPRGNQL